MPGAAWGFHAGQMHRTGMKHIKAVPRHEVMKFYQDLISAPRRTQAYFSVVGNGEVDELGPNDGDPLPGGRQPDASCVVQVRCGPAQHSTAVMHGAVVRQGGGSRVCAAWSQALWPVEPHRI